MRCHVIQVWSMPAFPLSIERRRHPVIIPRLVRVSRATAVSQRKSKASTDFSVASCLRINSRRKETL